MGSYTLVFPCPFSSLPCSLPLRFSWPIEAERRKGHWLPSGWNFPVFGSSKSTKSKQTNKQKTQRAAELGGRQVRQGRGGREGRNNHSA